MVDTIFFGGGTPSRTSVENLARIVARPRERFDVAADAEFSLEANPEDIALDSLLRQKDRGAEVIGLRLLGAVEGALRERCGWNALACNRR